MGRLKDMTGKVFARLRVIGEAGRDHRGEALWDCICDCGNRVKVYGGNLRSGASTSCGCLSADRLREMRTKHRMTGSPEYYAWTAMWRRCSNAGDKMYHRYGARGIVVCDHWSEFQAFYDDMGPRPSAKHTLERKDNDGPYAPSNCIWATRKEQNRNKSDNRYVMYRGTRMILIDAIAAAGNIVKRETARNRLKIGWTIEDALETPPNRHRHPSAKWNW